MVLKISNTHILIKNKWQICQLKKCMILIYLDEIIFKFQWNQKNRNFSVSGLNWSKRGRQIHNIQNVNNRTPPNIRSNFPARPRNMQKTIMHRRNGLLPSMWLIGSKINRARNIKIILNITWYRQSKRGLYFYRTRMLQTIKITW